MQTKTAKIQDMIRHGDIDGALRLAGKFWDRSEDTRLYKQAASARLNPEFYRQIGHDPDMIIAQARDRLLQRFA